MSLDIAVATSIIATLLMVFTYTYLYIQYRHTYLAKWVAAWALLATRVLFMEKDFVNQALSPGLTVLYGAMSFGYSLLMIAGAAEFAGKRLSVVWPIAGLFCSIITSVGILTGLPFEVWLIPAVIFVGWAYIGTGLTIWKTDVRGLGRTLTAGSFILLGIHMFDMPFLVNITWFAPWGFMLDGVLKLMVAIGIVFVFFEKARKELERYYRLLAENTIDVIYLYRLGKYAKFEYVSQAVKELTGYEPNYFKTVRNVMRRIHPDDRCSFKKILKAPTASDGFVTIRILHKDGEPVWVEHRCSFTYGPDGEHIAVEGIVRNVTKRVLLEQDISRLDRLNVAGQMAVSLAHEIRNPLTTVRGYLQFFRNKQEFSRLKDQLDLMVDELDRTNSIISEYLALSQNKVSEMKKCELNDIILSIYPLMQANAIASKAEVSLDLGEIPEIYVDDKEMKQVVLNFTRNAIEAMPAGGRVEIKTYVSGDEISLSFKDHGKGIPPHVLQNLGKPFVTTKEFGTGLGMAICYQIINRHNAKLNIDTGPAGTTIQVKFKSN